MALDVSRIPPIGSRGFDYFRANILPSERVELDAYVASLQNPVTKQPVKQPAREEVVDLNADPFPDSFADDKAGFFRPPTLTPVEDEPTPAVSMSAPAAPVDYSAAQQLITPWAYSDTAKYGQVKPVVPTGDPNAFLDNLAKATPEQLATVSGLFSGGASQGIGNISGLGVGYDASMFQDGTSAMPRDLDYTKDFLSSVEKQTANLKGLQKEDPTQFQKVYDTLDSASQKRYLYFLYESGDLDKEKYEQSVLSVEAADDPNAKITMFNGKPAKVYSNGEIREIVFYPDQWKTPYSKKQLESEAYASNPTDRLRGSEETGFLYGGIGGGGKVLQEATGFYENMLNNPLIQVAGMIAPPIQVATTAVKAAAGYDVSPMEIATAGLNSLQIAGAIRPPQGVAEGVIGPADPGQGLFGLDYGQTTGLVRAAAADNLAEGVVQAFGAPLVQDAINKININVGGAANLGMQPDDLAVGLNQTIASLAGGADLKDALLEGGLAYLQEGGSLPDAIAEPIKAVGDALKEVVGDVGSFFDDAIFQNIKDIAPDLSGVEDVFREAGSTVEDVVRAGGTALEPIVDPVVEAAKPVIAAVEEKAPAIEDAARAVGSKIDDVLNPFYDILKGAVGGMLGGQLAQAGQAQQQQQVVSPTRTTDSLFGDELFRFKTQVGSEMPELVKLQRRYQA